MKIGTIGTGFITDWVMRQMLEYDDYSYEAVYSRKEESAMELKNKYHVPKVYTNLDDMLNDEAIDLIYVASPNALHFEHAKRAMLAGKHAIVEKPFCSNVKECEELIRICKETGCFLFEAITTVYNPNYIQLKKELEKIGPIKVIESNMSQYSRKYDAFLEGKQPNVFTPRFSGGALMDINVYNLHFIVGLFGVPRTVQYQANIKEGIDTSGIVTLNYDSCVATSVGSKDNIGYNFTQLQGENGYIFVEGASSMTKKIQVILKSGESFEMNNQDYPDSHYYYAGAMLEMMKNKEYEKCYTMLEHSLNVMKVLDAARQDAQLVFDADFREEK